MGKSGRDGSPAKKEEIVCAKSVEAAMQLERPLPPEQDQLDSLSMMVLTLTGFGIMKANPVLNWTSWFVLLSFFINRANTQSLFSQSLISLVMVTVSTGIVYWRMMNGTIPLGK
jgi:hypothetical protein